MAWQRIRSWNVDNGNGSSEIFHLERDGDLFRIINDYGNTEIQMDKMSGHEFLKKLSDAYTDQVEDDMWNWFDDDETDPDMFSPYNIGNNNDDNDDCDGV